MTMAVLFRNHFQLGYVVRDLERAMQDMRDKFGVSKWQVRHPPRPAPARALGFAYVQDMMIELIEVWPGEDTIYHPWIPEAQGASRLHHFGYMIDSEEDWRSTIAQFEAAGIPSVLSGSAGDLLDYHYVDTVPQLGHYCELIRFRQKGRNMWADVPRN